MELLDAEAVRARLPMTAAIEAMRATFTSLAAGEVTAPPRGFHEVPALGQGGMVATMPAHVAGTTDVLATKVVSIVPDNADRGLPSIHGLLVAFDGTTGEPLGAVDGTVVTAIRTAAVSGLATDLLAPVDATTLAILGTGVQGREHVEAVRAVRDVAQVRLWNRTRAGAERLAAELTATGLDAVVLDTPGEAAAGADVICTCTGTSEALLVAGDVRAGAHVNAVGAFTPTMRELAADLVAAAVQPPPDGTTTVFKSVGHAAEDAVTAARLLR